ncbi:MarR family winged helix-turn-helix transcriptional regulator [Mycobacterium sp. AZCC_0083]|uniref:MarR family winged helix-turn-helix transcriptional regulator n=1 Tax=Mycobacterium sp. AZCC_0083 TaxID=2735882 RepID=UPI0017B432D2|nr:MarR family winged helix-turn-helix transcriptional regulator [Mycobacterium sp. AZCC_0083]MBB5161285.1 DNA-binding MarR family transcriptional regulator [Mycobacterium sp. AZCC_0083]
MSGTQPSKRRGQPRWLTPEQQRAWLAYIRVQLRMNYEMNRQLQLDSGLSLSDYDILVALSNAPHTRMRVADLAAQIGWERSRVSHHLRRMCARGLTERQPSPDDGRATQAWLTATGREAIKQAAPGHVELVQRLFFDSIPDELVAPLTAALEHVNVTLNLNSSLPPIPN